MRKIIVIMLVAAVAACTTIDCPVQNMVYTVYNVMNADGTAGALDTDTLWVWSQRADGTDTVISTHTEDDLELNCYFGPSASSFQLPISYTQPEDELYMLVGDTAGARYLDTVRIKKEDLPHFESVDCQASYFHKITAVATTHNIIDSIVINNPNVTYDATNAHFNIYFKAATER